jgi:hypothetical protein
MALWVISLSNMLSWKYRILLAAGTLGLAAWFGYSAERHVMDAAGSKPVTIQSVVRRVMAPKSRTGQIDKLNELRHAAGRTHPTPREIAEFWEIIRAFSIEDVKAYLAEIPPPPSHPVNHLLLQMLFYRWAQTDPEAAAMEAMQSAYDQGSYAILSVVTAWTARDPEGALRWAAGPDGRGMGFFADSAGRMLVVHDPEHALELAAKEFPWALSSVLDALARRAAGETVESGAKLISQVAALYGPAGLDDYLSQLVSSVARTDQEKAGLLIDAAEKAGASERMIQVLRIRSTHQEEPWDFNQAMDASFGTGSRMSEETQHSIYLSWVERDTNKVVAWATEAGRSDLLAEGVKKQSVALLRSAWHPAIGSSGGHYSKSVLTQYAAWQKLDAPAAEAWLQTMPMDIRTHLSTDPATR